MVLSEVADFVYKCTDYYHPESERGIAWDDPDLAIEWPDPGAPYLLSDRDRVHPTLNERGDANLPLFVEGNA